MSSLQLDTPLEFDCLPYSVAMVKAILLGVGCNNTIVFLCDNLVTESIY